MPRQPAPLDGFLGLPGVGLSILEGNVAAQIVGSHPFLHACDLHAGDASRAISTSMISTTYSTAPRWERGECREWRRADGYAWWPQLPYRRLRRAIVPGRRRACGRQKARCMSRRARSAAYLNWPGCGRVWTGHHPQLHRPRAASPRGRHDGGLNIGRGTLAINVAGRRHRAQTVILAVQKLHVLHAFDQRLCWSATKAAPGLAVNRRRYSDDCLVVAS